MPIDLTNALRDLEAIRPKYHASDCEAWVIRYGLALVEFWEWQHPKVLAERAELIEEFQECLREYKERLRR